MSNEQWFRRVLGLPDPAPEPVDLSTQDPRLFFEYLCRVKAMYAEMEHEPEVTLREMARPTLSKAPEWGPRGMVGVYNELTRGGALRSPDWWRDSLNGFTTHEEVGSSR